jgi:hypothetical protein
MEDPDQPEVGGFGSCCGLLPVGAAGYQVIQREVIA